MDENASRMQAILIASLIAPYSGSRRCYGKRKDKTNESSQQRSVVNKSVPGIRSQTLTTFNLSLLNLGTACAQVGQRLTAYHSIIHAFASSGESISPTKPTLETKALLPLDEKREMVVSRKSLRLNSLTKANETGQERAQTGGFVGVSFYV